MYDDDEDDDIFELWGECQNRLEDISMHVPDEMQGRFSEAVGRMFVEWNKFEAELEFYRQHGIAP